MFTIQCFYILTFHSVIISDVGESHTTAARPITLTWACSDARGSLSRSPGHHQSQEVTVAHSDLAPDWPESPGSLSRPWFGTVPGLSAGELVYYLVKVLPSSFLMFLVVSPCSLGRSAQRRQQPWATLVPALGGAPQLGAGLLTGFLAIKTSSHPMPGPVLNHVCGDLMTQTSCFFPYFNFNIQG